MTRLVGWGNFDERLSDQERQTTIRRSTGGSGSTPTDTFSLSSGCYTDNSEGVCPPDCCTEHPARRRFTADEPVLIDEITISLPYYRYLEKRVTSSCDEIAYLKVQLALATHKFLFEIDQEMAKAISHWKERGKE